MALEQRPCSAPVQCCILVYYPCLEYEFSPQPDPAPGSEFSLLLRLIIPCPSFIASPLMVGSGSSPPGLHILQIFAAGLFCPESLLDCAELWARGRACLAAVCSSTGDSRDCPGAGGRHVPLQVALAPAGLRDAARWALRRSSWGRCKPLGEPGSVVDTHPIGSGLCVGQLCSQSGAGKASNCMCAPTRGLGNNNSEFLLIRRKLMTVAFLRWAGWAVWLQ